MLAVNRLLQKIELVIGTVLTAGILIQVLINIIFRYLLNAPIMWSDEVSAFALIWITFLGIPYLFSRGDHVALLLLQNMMSEKMRRIITVVMQAVVIISMGLLLPGCLRNIPFLSRSPALMLSFRYIYIIMPVSYVLIMYHGLCNIIMLLKPERSEEGES